MTLNFLLSRNEQDTSHKLYMLDGSLAGNLILVSTIAIVLSYFLCFKQLIGVQCWLVQRAETKIFFKCI